MNFEYLIKHVCITMCLIQALKMQVWFLANSFAYIFKAPSYKLLYGFFPLPNEYVLVVDGVWLQKVDILHFGFNPRYQGTRYKLDPWLIWVWGPVFSFDDEFE